MVFTGLIKEVGTVVCVETNLEGRSLWIKAPKLITQIGVDDSVAVNGTCLTATQIKGECFTVQAVHTTLEKTGIGALVHSSKVNLELALRPMDRLGGHFVQGHVNTIGTLKSIVSRGENYELEFCLATQFKKYILNEGSIAIDGISLTVANEAADSFWVSIIPHTWENTNLKHKSVGDKVNIEVDVLAKYVEKLLFVQGTKKDLSLNNIKNLGY